MQPSRPLIDNMLTCVTKNTQKGVLFFRARLRSDQISDKGMFTLKRLRKGCNSTTIKFRDMGPFENSVVTHVNIHTKQEKGNIKE